MTLFKPLEYCPGMNTVDSIISGIYGTPAKAAAAHNVKRSAVSNWKAWGYFPERLVGKLLMDATHKGVPLRVTDIPTATHKPAVAG